MVPTLTEMQQKFVDIMIAETITPTEAARRAGFASPKDYSQELMETPHVAAAIIKGKNAELIPWRGLGAKGRRVLDKMMDETKQVKIQTECKKCGEVTLQVTEVPIKDTVRLNAARTVFTTLAKSSPGTLADKAAAEDTAETLAATADRILGVSPNKPLAN